MSQIGSCRVTEMTQYWLISGVCRVYVGSNRATFSQYGMLEMTYIGFKNEPNRVMSGHRNDSILAHIGSMSGLCRVYVGSDRVGLGQI